MDPFTIIALVFVLLLGVALFVRKRRGNQAKMEKKKLHDRVALCSTELLAALSVNDLDEAGKKRATLISHQAHWLSCNDCSVEFNQQLLKDCEQRIKVDTLNSLWTASQLQRSEVKIATLQSILETTGAQNVWFDSVPGGRKGIITSLVDEIGEWVTAVSALSPDTVESVKATIQKYISITQKYGSKMDFPDNWNEMVARDITRAEVNHFINVPELDFRQFIHALHRAVREHDTTMLAMLAATAIKGDDDIDEKLIHYLLVECTQEQPPIDAIGLVKLLDTQTNAHPMAR